MSLYHAIEIEKTGEHVYKGVSATVKDGRVTGITDTNTGTHKEIRVVGEENSPGNAMKTHKASWNVWDTVIVDNAPVNLYFYDLNQVDTREDPDTGELLVLDKKGNPLCFADSVTGMAYVYDDYGRMLAYTVMMREIRYWSNPYRYGRMKMDRRFMRIKQQWMMKMDCPSIIQAKT